ncbi:peroxiredoxin [Geodermatophilus sp. DSM 44513]|uniref:peroxiredoxin n=1 Tax=Geodermatophilus sp. DSM 44513 TaxID=1528104 RepID=UPI001287922E|nr:peroxiredoxin [Geodermatophilus sp. DSM 44513]WNV75247.1 peroxiredoxin [Geodermatophilus sp. DSM 44513]
MTSTPAMPAAPSRLQQLEERFAELGDRLDDSPVTEALSVLHAIVQEVARQAPPPSLDPAGSTGTTLQDVADLYLTAPPMSGAAESTGLPVGTAAPDFTLPDANGQPVSLSDFRGRPVVLVFYPLDWSPGCSRQLELYQQELGEFEARGASVIGVSVDSIYSHGAWAAVRGITFPLLADFHPKGEVARHYGVWRESDGFSDRALYVIDADGVIRYADVSPRVEHLPDIYDLYAALDQLTAQRSAA